MKKVIVIKIDSMLTAEQNGQLEAKFRREFKDGLMILPHYCTGFVTELDEEVNEMRVECEDEAHYSPTFNRKELKEALDYWYEHFEVNNEEQNRAVWCAINTINYCIEHDSGYQEGEENEDSQL